MRTALAAALIGAGICLAPGNAPAQSLGFSEINWCKWQNPPLHEIVAAIGEMERQLDQIQQAIDLMSMVEGFATGDEGPRDFGELATQLHAMQTYARLGRLYDSRHHVLNCLYNKLEELQARGDIRRGPAGRRSQIRALKDKAGGLRQRRDRLGPAHDTIEVEADPGGGFRITKDRDVLLYRDRTLRRIRGGTTTTPGGVELDVGLNYRIQWNPRFRIGANGAAREFSADTREFLPRVELRLPLRALLDRPAWLGFQAEGGASERKRSGGDLTGPGHIFSIDGANRQNIVAARGARLDLDHHAVAIRAYVAGRLREWNGGVSSFSVHAGFQYSRDRWTYDFSQLVSGGGPFFLHAVRSDVASDFYGARFGGTLVQRLAENVVLEVAGHVTPGHQRDRLTATQFPGTFGPGTLEVGQSRSGFAVRTGVSAFAELRALGSVFVSGGIGYEHNSRVPRIDGLTGGRASLGQGKADSLIVMIRARILLQ